MPGVGAIGRLGRGLGGNALHRSFGVALSSSNADVQAYIDAGWIGSTADVAILETFAASLLAVSAVSTAKANSKLLVWPGIGADAESRKMCLFHPSGVGTKVTSAGGGNIDYDALGAANSDGASWIDYGWDLTGLTLNDMYVGHIADRMNTGAPLNSVIWNASGSKIADRVLLVKRNAQALRSACNYSASGTDTVANSTKALSYGYISSGYGPSDRIRLSFDGVIIDDPATPSRAPGGAGTNNICFLGPASGTGNEYSNFPAARISPDGVCRVRGVIVCPFLSDADDISVSDAMHVMSNARRNLELYPLTGKTVHIAPIMSQSNALGTQQRSTLVSSATTAATMNRGTSEDDVTRNLIMWDRNDTSLKLAQQPLPHLASNVYQGLAAFYYGLQDFAEANPDDIVLTVPVAEGSTDMSSGDWIVGGPNYNNAVTQYNAAKAAVLAAGGTIGKTINCWCGNEGDKIWGGDPNTAKPLYEVGWNTMADTFAKATGQTDPIWLCFPVGHGQADNIMDQLNTMAGYRQKMSVLLESDVTFPSIDDAIDGGDPVHWSAIGNRSIGPHLPAQLAAAEANVKDVILSDTFDSDVEGWVAAGATVGWSAGKLTINGGAAGVGGRSSSFNFDTGVAMVVSLKIKASASVTGVLVGFRKVSDVGNWYSNTKSINVTTTDQVIYAVITPTHTATDGVVFIRLPGAANLTVDDVEVRIKVNDFTPTNTAVPVVSGTTSVGNTLTTTNGTWVSPSLLTYTRKWFRADPLTIGGDVITFEGSPIYVNAEEITGETGTTYTLTSDDLDMIVWSEVTATRGANTTTVESAATGPIT